MKKFVAITGILILCLASILVCGCTQPATPPVTPAATPTATTIPVATTAAPQTTATPPVTTMKVYNESANGNTITVPLNGTFAVVLLENPTTGYSWNVTVTSGLGITNNTFIPPQSTLMGAGGSHEWDVKAVKTGQQKFSGVYKQPWMNTTANDTTFALWVNVT